MTDTKMHTEAIERNALAKLEFGGALIRDRGEMLSLTDMWKAAGADPARRPVEWLRSADAQRFLTFLAESHGRTEVGNSHFGLVEVGKGGSQRGATYAHWQVGLAYAKYLSPEFHMWANTVVRERMEGMRRGGGGLEPALAEMMRRDDGILRMLAHKVSEIERTIPAVASRLMAEMLPAMVELEIASRQYGMVQGYTAGRVVDMAGVKDRRRVRGVISLTSGKLRRYHAERGVPVKLATLGASSAYVFDPIVSREWLDQGGKAFIERYVAEKRGQTSLFKIV